MAKVPCPQIVKDLNYTVIGGDMRRNVPFENGDKL